MDIPDELNSKPELKITSMFCEPDIFFSGNAVFN